MTIFELTARVALSLILGGLIGAERQWRQRNAGLRTNTLVSIGATLFVSLSFFIDDEVSPTRVAAQVVSGIGFLGAGVILREGLNIRGLNTAATLWCSAATGVLCGAGLLWPAIIGTGAILAANVGLRPLAARLNRQNADDSEESYVYRLSVACRPVDEIHVRALTLEAVRANGLTPRAISTLRTKRDDRVRIGTELLAEGRGDEQLEKVLTRLSLQSPVLGVVWRVLAESNGNGSEGGRSLM